MTDNQREMMLHALGGTTVDYFRNHYCAEVGGADARSWEELVVLGMATRGGFINNCRDRYYHVTVDGVKALKEDNQ